MVSIKLENTFYRFEKFYSVYFYFKLLLFLVSMNKFTDFL